MYDLPAHLVAILALDDDAEIAASAVMQPLASAETLAAAASKHPTLIDQIALNDNAPPQLLARRPLAYALPHHIQVFLDWSAASTADREELEMTARRASEQHQGDLTIQQAWDEIVRRKAGGRNLENE